MYGKAKKKVTSLCKEQDHVSITTYLWSSVAKDLYLSLTAHFINFNIEQERYAFMQLHLMTTIEVNGFASVITNCLQAWGIAEK